MEDVDIFFNKKKENTDKGTKYCNVYIEDKLSLI